MKKIKKYLLTIPNIIYPYVFSITSIVLLIYFLVLLNFPSDDNDVVIGNILEIGLIVLSAFLIIYTLLCLVFAIVIAVFSTNNKITYFEA